MGNGIVNWTENGVPVSQSAVYPFTVNGDRTLVANFVRTYTIATSVRITYSITTSASPAAGGTTSGGGTVNSGDNVTVVASANPGYSFVNWTEGGVVVSASASYSFLAGANRSLVANFASGTPVLEMSAATAVRHHGKIDVTIVIENSGGATAQAVTVGAKKDATIDRKATREHAPITLGNIAPGGTATTTLTFSGVKKGTRTLQVRLTYTGGTATLSIQVLIPGK